MPCLVISYETVCRFGVFTFWQPFQPFASARLSQAQGTSLGGATVAVWGVQDILYGTPPIYAISGALSAWSGALGNPISTQVWLAPGSPPYVNNVEVVYQHLGNGGPLATTYWGDGAALMQINVDKVAPPDVLPLVLAHEAGHAFGAAECAGCGSWVTIMDGTNIGAGNPGAPLPCDQELMYDVEGYGSATCNAGTIGLTSITMVVAATTGVSATLTARLVAREDVARHRITAVAKVVEEMEMAS
jgi:hypothetical protein